MRIAIPVNDDQVTVCPSFGRAPYFWVTDTQNGNKSVFENQAARSEGGTGIRAAQALLDLGAEALITPRLGENAANVLKSAGIALYISAFGGAQENVDALLSGSLKPLTEVHAGFHHGGR